MSVKDFLVCILLEHGDGDGRIILKCKRVKYAQLILVDVRDE